MNHQLSKGYVQRLARLHADVARMEQALSDGNISAAFSAAQNAQRELRVLEQWIARRWEATYGQGD